MKKLLFLLSAALIAAATVKGQLYYTPQHKLTFGDISVPTGCVTAWEGTGHYFHNGSSASGNTWLKLDLTGENAAFVPSGDILTLKNADATRGFYIDLSKQRPHVYTSTESIVFKYRTNGLDLYAGGLYSVSDATKFSGSMPIENALGLVSRMVPRYYPLTTTTWRRGTFYGFYGQELEKVVPDIVSRDEDGTRYVNYSAVVPILTKAIQELTATVAQLEERIRELEGGKTQP